MKRFGRYLMGTSSLGPRYEADSFNDFKETELDADWVRCEMTRRSNFGGVWFARGQEFGKTVRLQLCSKFTGAAESLFVKALVNVICITGDV